MNQLPLSMKVDNMPFNPKDFLPGDTVSVNVPGTTITLTGTVVDGDDVADNEIAVSFAGNADWTPVSVGLVVDAWFRIAVGLTT